MDRRMMVMSAIFACSIANNDYETLHKLFLRRLEQPSIDKLSPRRKLRASYDSLGGRR